MYYYANKSKQISTFLTKSTWSLKKEQQMSQHILIVHAKRKPYTSSPEMPEGAVFDSTKGYWVSDDKPLISPTSKYGALTTKKCDQETGEDQKGE